MDQYTVETTDTSEAEVYVPVTMDVKPGRLAHLTCAAVGETPSITLYGMTTQFTSTGKNLVENTLGLADGQNNTVVCNEVTYKRLTDGRYTLSGTTKGGSFRFWLKGSTESSVPCFTLTAGTAYTIRDCQLFVGGNTYIASGSHTPTEDTLVYGVCMLIGNNLTYDKTRIRYPMVVAGNDDTWEPYTGGNRAAYLSGVQLSGKEISLSGKNLIKLKNEEKTISGVTVTVQEDGTVSMEDKCTADSLMTLSDFSLPAGTYTLSCGDVSADGAAAVQIREREGNKVVGASLAYVGVSRSSQSFTLQEKTDLRCQLVVHKDHEINGTFHVQLESGAAGTDFMPSTQQALSATWGEGIPGIPVSSGGNYGDAQGQRWVCDTLELPEGKYTQRIGQVTLTGSTTETWVQDEARSADGYHCFRLNLSDKKQGIDNLLCSHFTVAAEAAANVVMGSAEEENPSPVYFYVPTDTFTSETDLIESWKEFLQNNNITLQYELQETVELDVQTAVVGECVIKDAESYIYTDCGANLRVSYLVGIKPCVRTIVQDWVTPEMFGAKADGVSDDTVALQSAITFCINNEKPLYLAAGTYAVYDTLHIPGHLVITGTAVEQGLCGTTILCKGIQDSSSACIKIGVISNSTDLFPRVRMHNIVLQNDAGSNALCGISATRCIHSDFENITVRDFPDYGFCFFSDWVEADLVKASLYNNTFKRCYAYNAHYGFYFDGGFSDCEFDYCGAYIKSKDFQKRFDAPTCGFYIDFEGNTNRASNDVRFLRFGCASYDYGIYKAEKAILRNVLFDACDIELFKKGGIYLETSEGKVESTSIIVQNCYLKATKQEEGTNSTNAEGLVYGIYFGKVYNGEIKCCNFEKFSVSEENDKVIAVQVNEACRNVFVSNPTNVSRTVLRVEASVCPRVYVNDSGFLVSGEIVIDGSTWLEKRVILQGVWNSSNGSFPTDYAAGSVLFYADIGRPVWFNGTDWVEGSGTIVSVLAQNEEQ